MRPTRLAGESEEKKPNYSENKVKKRTNRLEEERWRKESKDWKDEKKRKEVEGKLLCTLFNPDVAYTFTFTTTPKLVPIARAVYHGCNDRRRH
jgi:hypothetical protein